MAVVEAAAAVMTVAAVGAMTAADLGACADAKRPFVSPDGV